MTGPDRRTFLAGLGAGMLSSRSARGVQQSAARTPELDALAEILRTVPREDAVAKAVELHRSGVTWRDLLGATFLAGIRDIEPRPVGFQFHCVLMTSSAFQIAEGSPPEDRLLPALFNVADLKASQQADANAQDWTLPPAPARDLDARTAARELRAALDAWDPSAADAAATALARSASLDEAFEVLWEYGARDFTNIGHKAIFVAQSHRTLQQIGWRYGEEVLRSLVYGLLDGKPGTNDAAFAPNRERAARLRVGWAPGKESATAGLELLATLRDRDASGAADTVVELLNGGLALESVLDALRLFAVEQLWRAPGILAVHVLTALNALRYGAVRSQSDATRKVLVLQAVSWLEQYRAFLAARGSYDAALPGIDALSEADGEVGADQVFTAAADDRRAAAPKALRAARKDHDALTRALRHWLVRKAREHHDYKFAAALIEEAQLAAPDVGARMLAAGLAYARTPGDEDAAVWRALKG